MSEEKKANRFLAAKVTRKADFMGLSIEITKLTVAQVMQIQEKAQVASSEDSEEAGIALINTVLRLGAAELADLSDEELSGMPLDELSKLSNEIMKYSGLSTK